MLLMDTGYCSGKYYSLHVHVLVIISAYFTLRYHSHTIYLIVYPTRKECIQYHFPLQIALFGSSDLSLCNETSVWHVEPRKFHAVNN